MEIDVNILRICYEQYFCNVCDLTNEELLSLHFKVNEALDLDEDIFWDDPALTAFVVWRPFEDVLPTYIFDNILESHKRIWQQHDDMYNQICLEVSCELAEDRLAEYFIKEVGQPFEYTDNNGDTRLTEDAQEIFNEYQAHYENLIRGYSEKE